MTNNIHFIAGESGGVGKTTVCISIVAFLLALEKAFALFDADRSKWDVYHSHKHLGCQKAVLSEAQHLQDGANALFEAALEKDVLVNMSAASFIPLAEWLKNSDLLPLAKEEGITFYLWFISDGSATSNKLLFRSLKHFQGAVPHIVIKNHGRGTNFQFFDDNEKLTSILNHFQTPVLDFPVFFGEKERQTIMEKRLSLLEASQHPDFGPISRQRIKKFLRETGAVFEQVGVF